MIPDHPRALISRAVLALALVAGLLSLEAPAETGSERRMISGMQEAILCQSAGWVLFSGGPRLVFADRGTSYRRVLVFVLALSQTFADPAGESLAPLASVRFAPVMQLGSSSRALAASWSGGSMVVYRGSPFAGGFQDALDALRRHGVDPG